MTGNDLNQQTINFSGQSYKSLPFRGINSIDAYFQASNRAVAWKNDQYLAATFSINYPTVFSFSIADSNALSNSDFLPSQIIQ